MKTDYLADLTLYIWIRALSSFFSALPLRASLGIGRTIAMLAYIFPNERKKTAYRNIRLAFSDKYNPQELKQILKKTYQNWGMNFIEALMLSRMNSNYLNKYIQAQGLDKVKALLDQNKGVVMMGSHFGSWEILHIGIPQKGGFPFHILARPQKYKMAANYLDRLRNNNNCFVIYKGMGSREAISILKANKAFGLVIDQGGRTEDAFIKFFGRLTPTPTGVVRFAQKFDAPIVAGYITRINGPYHKIKMLEPYILEKKENFNELLVYNLEKLNQLLENYVREYPSEYFWFHKRWKYSQDKNILVLTDGKAGHLRQSEAFLAEFKKVFDERSKACPPQGGGFNLNIKFVEVKFKNRFRKLLFNIYAFIFGNILNCPEVLKFALQDNSYEELVTNYADIVLSCGSTSHAANLLLAKENYAKSVVLMHPGILLNRFNLVIAPSHDRLKQGKNVFITKGALNLIDEGYLSKQKEVLASRINYKDQGRLKIGILLGADTKVFKLNLEVAGELISQLKKVESELNAELFITTSRRTQKGLEAKFKEEFLEDKNCRLLVIANEENIPEAVGGILGICDIIITSPDSISMASEAASSGKYTVVFKPKELKPSKHALFLQDLAKNEYINLIEINELENTVKKFFYDRPKVKLLDNKKILREAINRLF